jgi:hypothetical protein
MRRFPRRTVVIAREAPLGEHVRARPRLDRSDPGVRRKNRGELLCPLCGGFEDLVVGLKRWLRLHYLGDGA